MNETLGKIQFMFSSNTYPLSNRCVIHTSFYICIKGNEKYHNQWITILIDFSINTRNPFIMQSYIKNDP